MAERMRGGGSLLLSRDRIVVSAVALADERGLGHLTMRRLGEALGVEAMSLYHHVPGKEALLDAMVDAVFAEIDVPVADDWRQGLRARAESQRAALLRHPWALRLVESRDAPGLANLRHHDAVLGYLGAAGFPPRAAGHAYALLDAFVYGFVLQEQQLPFDAATAPETASAMLASLPGASFPHLEAFMREVVLAGGYDFGDEFDVGLGLVLGAIAGLRG